MLGADAERGRLGRFTGVAHTACEDERRARDELRELRPAGDTDPISPESMSSANRIRHAICYAAAALALHGHAGD
ncbi:MAG: hypothetical protein Tsb0020_18520 [Haliangiales bacterium]